MPSGLFYLNSLDRSIPYIKGAWFLSLSCFVKNSELNANSVDPDQTPRSAASDLGLHRLPMSFLWGARLKWVKSISANQESCWAVGPITDRCIDLSRILSKI